MNRYLTKIAAEVTLGNHQQRVVERVKEGPVLAAHSLGSGKTLTALQTVIEARKKNPHVPALVVTPASLVHNMWKEVEKHGLPITKEDMVVVSYEEVANNPERYSSRPWGAVITDEAHRLRNKGTKKKSAMDAVFESSPNALRLPMTATPVFNKPEDIGVILNTVAGKKVLPDDAKGFEEAFIRKEVVKPGFVGSMLGVKPGERKHLKNQGDLRRTFHQYVDYYDAKSDPTYAENFPKSTSREVEVEMGKEQQRMYEYLEGKLPMHLRWKIRMGLPLSKQESSSLNAFSTGVRQASNTPAPYYDNETKRQENRYTNKLNQMAVDFDTKMKNTPNGKGIVYSNYMDAGLLPMQDLLKQKGYRTDIYSGKLTAKQKKALENSYNAGELDALLLSSSGSEGLDLKGTRMVQIMEPHFNESKINQVTGRAIRYKSHEALPEDQRDVEVVKYLSTKKPGFLNKVFGTKDMAIDRYLTQASADKARVDNQIRKLMEESTAHYDAKRK